MKYRKENYYEKDGVGEFPGTDFDHYQKRYHFNEDTLELEDTGEVDNTDELVNSSKDCALSAILDKFLPEYEGNDDEAYAPYEDELDKMVEISNFAEEIRSKYNLPDSYSMDQIFDELQIKYDKLKSSKIPEFDKEYEKQKVTESEEIKNNGGASNESQVVEKS